MVFNIVAKIVQEKPVKSAVQKESIFGYRKQILGQKDQRIG